MIKFVLTDIEGTITSLSFVRDILFPYSQKRMATFIRGHRGDLAVRSALQQMDDEEKEAEKIERLLQWIKEDRKHPSLKLLQGLIWREGFQNGDYKGHFYDDVYEVLPQWKKRGLTLGIYSSGSVEAQKLLCTYGEKANLTHLFSFHFDTQVGAKVESTSYQRILQQISFSGEEVLFLSDIEKELDAAKLAGMKVMQLVREGEGTVTSERHPWVSDLRAIKLETA